MVDEAMREIRRNVNIAHYISRFSSYGLLTAIAALGLGFGLFGTKYQKSQERLEPLREAHEYCKSIPANNGNRWLHEQMKFEGLGETPFSCSQIDSLYHILTRE